jgi:hypothetical protein
MAAASPVQGIHSALKQEILSTLSRPHVTEISQDSASAVPCSTIIHALIDADRLINIRAVKHQFRAEISPEAVTALKSSQSQPWPKQCNEILVISICCRMPRVGSWTLSEALHLRITCCVEFFAERFIGELFNASSAFAS